MQGPAECLDRDDLHKIINGCLQFDRIGNATEQMSEISSRAKEALARIGLESAINARRVTTYGIKVDDTPQSAQTRVG